MRNEAIQLDARIGLHFLPLVTAFSAALGLGALRLLRTQLLAATIGFSALGGLAVAAIVHFALGALPGPYLGLSAGCAWIRREALDIVNQRIAKGATMSSTSENIVQLAASGGADQVEARLHEALDGHGLQLFARIDHAAGARKAGLELQPDVLLIFGNTNVGTPLMQADPRVGIELPLRMLIWQDDDGTHVGYFDPRELAGRYALDGHQKTLERQAAVLDRVAAAAAG